MHNFLLLSRDHNGTRGRGFEGRHGLLRSRLLLTLLLGRLRSSRGGSFCATHRFLFLIIFLITLLIIFIFLVLFLVPVLFIVLFFIGSGRIALGLFFQELLPGDSAPASVVLVDFFVLIFVFILELALNVPC